MGNVEAWDCAATQYQKEFQPDPGVIPFGPDLPDDGQLKLVPTTLSGKRVLDLGCGAGQAVVAFAERGARVIGIDSSARQLAAARGLADGRGARVELHHDDLCALAFVPAESVDVVFCAATLDYVDDLGRVLRSVHRVMRPGAAFLFTLEHPLARPSTANTGAYDDPAPFEVARYGETFVVHPRTVAETVAAVTRASLRIEALAEPVPPGQAAPVAMAWKIRKEGR